MWIRTTYAWYKCVRPSAEYEKFYMPIYKPIRLASLVLACMRAHPNCSWDEWVEMMTEYGIFSDASQSTSNHTAAIVASSSSSSLQSNACLRAIISRFATADREPIAKFEYPVFVEWSIKDLHFYSESIIDEANLWMENNQNYEFASCPLLFTLCGFKNKRMSMYKGGSDIRCRREAYGAIGHRDAPKNENPATVTALVSSLAKGLFAKHLVNDKTFKVDGDAKNVICKIPIKDALIPTAPYNRSGMKFCTLAESIGTYKGREYYESVSLRDLEGKEQLSLSVGMFIAISSSKSKENLNTTNPVQLMQLTLIFKNNDGTIGCHGRQFIRANESMLEEVGEGSNELFAVDNCLTCALNTAFYAKLMVKRVLVGDQSKDAQDGAFDHLFYR